jgi:hypothetical protein
MAFSGEVAPDVGPAAAREVKFGVGFPRALPRLAGIPRPRFGGKPGTEGAVVSNADGCESTAEKGSAVTVGMTERATGPDGAGAVDRAGRAKAFGGDEAPPYRLGGPTRGPNPPALGAVGANAVVGGAAWPNG